MSETLAEILSYDEVVAYIRDGRGLVLDVRSADELNKHGRLPGSFLNIPHTEVDEAMQLPSEEFQRRYGAEKPDTKAPILISCMSGRRAGLAADAMRKLGFSNIGVYKGSWNEWKVKQEDAATAYAN